MEIPADLAEQAVPDKLLEVVAESRRHLLESTWAVRSSPSTDQGAIPQADNRQRDLPGAVQQRSEHRACSRC